jgi:hypothetical protein
MLNVIQRTDHRFGKIGATGNPHGERSQGIATRSRRSEQNGHRVHPGEDRHTLTVTCQIWELLADSGVAVRAVSDRSIA